MPVAAAIRTDHVCGVFPRIVSSHLSHTNSSLPLVGLLCYVLNLFVLAFLHFDLSDLYCMLVLGSASSANHTCAHECSLFSASTSHVSESAPDHHMLISVHDQRICNRL